MTSISEGDWPIKTLGQVATVVNGGTPKSKVPEYWGGSIQWLTPKDMGNMDGREINETPRTITNSGLGKSSARLIPANSVILSTRAPIGHLAINEVPMAFNQGCRGLVPKEGLDHVFLYYFLLGSRVFLQELGTGTTFKELSANNLKSVPIGLPPLEEQRRIVAVLDSAFEGLERARTRVEANLRDTEKLFQSFLAREFSQGQKSWEVAALNDHVRFIDYRGKTPPKAEQGVRLITAKNVKMGFIQREPEEFVAEDAYEGWMTRGFPQFGDVLFTTEAPLGNVTQLDTDERVIVGQRLITMQPDQGILLSNFLKFALMSPQMQTEILIRGTGATVLGIKARLLKTVSIRFPKELEDQRRVSERCQRAYEYVEELRLHFISKLRELDDSRQSFLQRALAGELT